ncbi:MAG: twitching motility protein PilT [Lachnospiraceae bacterium]|nr:twitching motility protein PilT [Lachnospiraceae bacterium]MBP5653549.1 twitching motility protein PilT [Lachnospiraceae bacterium]
MIEIITGRKGKGKTKYLLEKANQAMEVTSGTICYVDKSTKHMYELNNQIRLVNVYNYPVSSYESFVGFVSGLIAQDYDLDKIFFDSFLTISGLESDLSRLSEAISTLYSMSEKFHVSFVLSISLDEADLPEYIKQFVTLSL